MRSKSSRNQNLFNTLRLALFDLIEKTKANRKKLPTAQWRDGIFHLIQLFGKLLTHHFPQ